MRVKKLELQGYQHEQKQLLTKQRKLKFSFTQKYVKYHSQNKIVITPTVRTCEQKTIDINIL